MFLRKDEQELTEEYLEQGYVIRPVADLVALNWIKDKFIKLSKKLRMYSLIQLVDYVLLVQDDELWSRVKARLPKKEGRDCARLKGQGAGKCYWSALRLAKTTMCKKKP